MLASRSHLVTYREDAADAEIPSHRLLLRGGYIVKVGAGLYVYSPIMWRVLRKIERIVREELDRAGALEIQAPILQPVEYWEESGRLAVYKASGTMLFTRDRNGGEFGLAPTAEEIVTAFVKATVQSYRQVPLTLYQIHTKMRDEIRPRFGLLRVKEFIMKDAYSFDIDKAGMEKSYQAMKEAYFRIFSRMGLEALGVEADPGDIGGSGSMEFMIAANTGEDTILIEEGTGYAANVEKAVSRLEPPVSAGDELKPLEIRDTPNIRTCEQLRDFFDGFAVERMIKTILYKLMYAEEEKYCAVLMRGNKEINEVKLKNHFGCLAVKMLAGEEIQALTGAEMGFAGPIGLNPRFHLLADESVRGMRNVICGVNQNHKHALHANIDRDFTPKEYVDVRMAVAGDPGPVEGKPMIVKKGIEVGHIFQLGTKYSEPMQAKFLSKDGKQAVFHMGCYGVGVSRLAAAAVEQTATEQGFVWPAAIAPFHVAVTCLAGKDQAAVAATDQLYRDLQAKGFDVLLDDRDLTVGVRLKDLELMGIPSMILIGKKWKESGEAEIKIRASGKTLYAKLDQVAEVLKQEGCFA